MNFTHSHLQEQKPLPQIEHIAFGVFDGFHLGHRAVIAAMLEQSGNNHDKTAAITFEPHPLTVIAPEKAPPRLSTPQQKEELLLQAGVGLVLTLHFDNALRELTAADFLTQIHRIFPNLKSICVGPRWSFGKDRKGNLSFLRQEGSNVGYTVTEVEPFIFGGAPVSSTRIRQAIRHRHFDEAAVLLGRDYSIAGEVVHGSHRGQQIGFPTANLALIGQLLPPDGVYACQALLPSKKSHNALVNIGKRPTFGDHEVSVETHIPDFNENLYGQELQLSKFHFLRGEKKFNGPDELKAQIHKDITDAQTYFS